MFYLQSIRTQLRKVDILKIWTNSSIAYDLQIPCDLAVITGGI